MSMKAELSGSAVRTGWEARGVDFSWRLISKSLMSSDLLALFVFAVFGLLLAISLTLLFSLPEEIAAIGQLS